MPNRPESQQVPYRYEQEPCSRGGAPALSGRANPDAAQHVVRVHWVIDVPEAAGSARAAAAWARALLRRAESEACCFSAELSDGARQQVDLAELPAVKGKTLSG